MLVKGTPVIYQQFNTLGPDQNESYLQKSSEILLVFWRNLNVCKWGYDIDNEYDIIFIFLQFIIAGAFGVAGGRKRSKGLVCMVETLSVIE